MKTTRRTFLKTAAITGATITGAGFLVAEGNAREESRSPNERLSIAGIGVGAKGGSDIDNAARFGNVVALCDIDKETLENKGKGRAFEKAKKYVDFREMLEKHEKEIDLVTISTPDHMHAVQTLMAMRMGKHVFTQKPLARTIYEARLLTQVAKESGVCTQMGNQGSSLDSARIAIVQLQAGIIGKVREIHVWSRRPVWTQGPNRRVNMERFATEAREKMDADAAEKAIATKQSEIDRVLEQIDWKLWLGVAPPREFFPGLYHPYQWRGWWDFGTGALGDVACHQVTVPFAGCGLTNPASVRARTTGHDYDSFPASSIIEFEFPANEERDRISFLWYDRQGNKPPQEVFAPYGIDRLADAGVLIIGDGGAFYSDDDYCGRYLFLDENGKRIPMNEGLQVELAEKKGAFDVNHMYELFRAVKANDLKICHSNFVDRAGPLTETILLGNLAVWTAAQGGPDGTFGDWGEKVEWDAANMVITNLSNLKTPRVADLIKPVYGEGYRLD